MAGIVEIFQRSPLFNSFGTVVGNSTGVAFPTRDDLCMVRFKAYSANTGSFFIGHQPTSCVWELDAGDDTGWIAANKLESFYYLNASGSGDVLSWWIQK